MKTSACLLVLSMSLGALQAQAANGDFVSVGVAVAAQQRPYAGSDTDVRTLPFVQAQYGDFFVQGMTFGYTALREDDYKLALLGNVRLNRLRSDDLDPPLAIEDRDPTVEAGVGFSTRLGARFSLESFALADVLDKHGGYEVGLRLSRSSIVGDFVLVPSVGVSWLSEDLTAYYYGLKPGEAGFAAGYAPGDVFAPQAGLSSFYALAERWSLIGIVGTRYLGSDIGDSPLVDSEWESTVLVGASYRFPL